jgi:hypothetical protein
MEESMHPIAIIDLLGTLGGDDGCQPYCVRNNVLEAARFIEGDLRPQAAERCLRSSAGGEKHENENKRQREKNEYMYDADERK